MISLNKAEKMMQAGQDKANELGVAVSICVVDSHGSVVATIRMDGAIPVSPRFAYAKAYTSASLGVPSQGLAEFAKEGNPYFGVNTIFGGEITPIAGGMPIKQEDKLIGGVGVGGSMDVSQDAAVAQAAIAALD